MTDEEYDKQVTAIHRRFCFRVLRAAAFLVATLFVLSWTMPDLRGPLLTLVMVGVPVASWTVDVLLDRK